MPAIPVIDEWLEALSAQEGLWSRHRLQHCPGERQRKGWSFYWAVVESKPGNQAGRGGGCSSGRGDWQKLTFKKELKALEGAIHLEETCHFAFGFVFGCNNATYHLQQDLQKCCFLSYCYFLLTVQLSKLPHATILLFASILAEYKTKSACENQELKLHCQESKFLIIYSAIYGRWAHEENVCSTEVERVPPFGMFLHCW